MDEPNDERTERTQPSQPASPWTGPEVTAPLPPTEATAPLPPADVTTPLPPTEATTPLPPAGPPTESQPIAGAPGAPEYGAPAGEASELLVSNQQPWAVPSWEPDWSHGARWEPAQPGRESDPGATTAAAMGPVVPEGSWSGAAGQNPPPANPSGAYPPGSYTPGDYPPGSYPPGVYAPGVYGPGVYGPGGPGGYGPGGYGPGGYGPGPNQPTGPERPKRGRKAAVLAAAALVLLGAGAGAGIAYAFRQDRGPSGALASSPPGKTLTTSQIEAEVSPAVVDIDTNLGEGTGIIATSNGEIITNNHVVVGATSIKVSILHHGTHAATVVGTDAKDDVAVLRLSGVSGLPTVKFGDSSTIKVGSSVVAIGNSGGLNLLPSPATSGAVTALGRSITASDESGPSENLKGMIQMNAQIQPGNSGGPLVDSSGEVVGMDTAAASTPDSGSQTVIGFALPINRVLQIANDIEKGKSGNGIVIGSVAFLGIAGETVQLQGSGQASGAGLEFVEPGSPADQAGIQQGDVIVAFNGHATTTMEALATLIHQLRPGDPATVTFLNTNGDRQTVTVTLGTGPPA